MVTDKSPFLVPMDVSKMLMIDIFSSQRMFLKVEIKSLKSGRQKIRIKVGNLPPKTEELAAVQL